MLAVERQNAFCFPNASASNFGVSVVRSARNGGCRTALFATHLLPLFGPSPRRLQRNLSVWALLGVWVRGETLPEALSWVSYSVDLIRIRRTLKDIVFQNSYCSFRNEETSYVGGGGSPLQGATAARLPADGGKDISMYDKVDNADDATKATRSGTDRAELTNVKEIREKKVKNAHLACGASGVNTESR